MAVPTYVAWRSETAVSTTQRRRGISKVLANSSAGACEHIRYRGHKGTHMSLDLFMNDTCARSRKPLKRARIERHPNRRDRSVSRRAVAMHVRRTAADASNEERLQHGRR